MKQIISLDVEKGSHWGDWGDFIIDSDLYCCSAQIHVYNRF